MHRRDDRRAGRDRTELSEYPQFEIGKATALAGAPACARTATQPTTTRSMGLIASNSTGMPCSTAPWDVAASSNEMPFRSSSAGSSRTKGSPSRVRHRIKGACDRRALEGAPGSAADRGRTSRYAPPARWTVRRAALRPRQRHRSWEYGYAPARHSPCALQFAPDRVTQHVLSAMATGPTGVCCTIGAVIVSPSEAALSRAFHSSMTFLSRAGSGYFSASKI